MDNLYVHFPFCRRKCSYCALLSRACSTGEARAAHVAACVRELETTDFRAAPPKTIYFGGGSPALCDLTPLLNTLDVRGDETEFTVELHPLDVTPELLQTLRSGGVNRISLGVQSVEDAVLADMGRLYTFDEAERAFALIKRFFDNTGIDLIVGYPGESTDLTPEHNRLARWGLAHCSVYSLILEEKSLLAVRKTPIPSDDEALDRVRRLSAFLADLGLERYEISNYARPGYACRHNRAVWRGEDYTGLGEGAHGREGLRRTVVGRDGQRQVTTVTPEEDAKERTLFRLRTNEGLQTAGHPEWQPILDTFVREGLLTQTGSVYFLTERGTEVCDAILAELV